MLARALAAMVVLGSSSCRSPSVAAPAADVTAAPDPASAAPREAAPPPPIAAREVDDPAVRRRLAELGARDAERGRILGLRADVSPSPGDEDVYAVGVGGIWVLAGPDAPSPGARVAHVDPSASGYDSLQSLLAVQAVPDAPRELLLEGFTGGSGGGELEMSLWKLGPSGLTRVFRGPRGQLRFQKDGALHHQPVAGAARRYQWDAGRFRFEAKSGEAPP